MSEPTRDLLSELEASLTAAMAARKMPQPAPDVPGLVKRLRGPWAGSWISHAADVLEAQQALIGRLREALEAAERRLHRGSVYVAYGRWVAACTCSLRREPSRLTRDLPSYDSEGEAHAAHAAHVAEAVRSALQAAENPQPPTH